MNRVISRILGLTLILLAPAVSFAGEPDYSDATVKAFLRSHFDVDKSGVCVVVGFVDAKGSRVVGVGSFKHGDGAVARDADGDTLFEIGSASKTFTTFLLQDMVERGEMRLDDLVAKYLPDSARMPTRSGKQITLLDLATHMSGLPRDPNNFVDSKSKTYYAGYSAERLYAFLSGVNLDRDPGAKFAYSNLGMGLLGHVVCRKAGKDYESLVVERICRPLGMDSTRVTLTPALKERLAPGRDEKGKPAVNFDDLGVVVGAGGIRSSVNDLLKYVAANAGITPSALTPVMRKTHLVRHHDSSNGFDGLYGNTGMAWMDEAQSSGPDLQLSGHPGGTAGYTSFIGFDAQHGRGVVVLINQSPPPIRGSFIGWTILEGLPLTTDSIDRVARRAANIVGIGVALVEDPATHAVRIRAVLSDTPAARAGIVAGQVIQKVGDAPIAGKTLKECTDLIRGPAGTNVRLELKGPDDRVAIVDVTRQKLQ